jgi:hypothetical protein
MKQYMTVFIIHSTEFDYQKEVYDPIRKSKLGKDYTILLPFETENMPYEIKQFFKSGKCDVLIAECSYPSIGIGLEIGWANMSGIKIVCINKKGSLASAALKMVSDYFLEYKDKKDMINQIERALKSLQ